MSPVPPARRRAATSVARGRPKDGDKRQAILDAAKRLFAALGLAGASMDAIARAAGVSKVTVYSHFSSKDELFRHAVMAKCAQHTPESIFDARTPEPLRERLGRIGQGFVDLVLDDEPMSLYRMMAAQGGRASRLGRLFWDAGPERTIQLMSQMLSAAHAAGELRIDDPRRAAAHFFCLLKGEHHLRYMVGAAPAATRAVRRAHVRDVVELFLRAYAGPVRR